MRQRQYLCSVKVQLVAFGKEEDLMAVGVHEHLMGVGVT